MRPLHLSGPLLLAALAVAPLFGETAPPSPAVRVAQAVKAMIAGASNVEDARRAAAGLPKVLGAKFEARNDEWFLRFGRRLPARDFCQGMGWQRPYAAAQGSHQGSWHIFLWRMDLFDFYKRPIIRTATPQVGRWAVQAWLTGRPKGELPKVSRSDSPAYDLSRYDGEVGGIGVKPWKPEYDSLWTMEQARKAQEKTPILTVAAEPASYQGPCPVEITFTGILHDVQWKKVDIRWERSDGVWTEIEPVEIRSKRQPVLSRWRVGGPGQKLEVWQKLHLGPSTLTSESATVQVRCE